MRLFTWKSSACETAQGLRASVELHRRRLRARFLHRIYEKADAKLRDSSPPVSGGAF